MKKFTPTSFSVAKVFCRIFGHRLKISKKITNHICEYKCENCDMEMTDTAHGCVSRLTPKFKETNDYIALIHRRRRKKNFAEAKAS